MLPKIQKLARIWRHCTIYQQSFQEKRSTSQQGTRSAFQFIKGTVSRFLLLCSFRVLAILSLRMCISYNGCYSHVLWVIQCYTMRVMSQIGAGYLHWCPKIKLILQTKTKSIDGALLQCVLFLSCPGHVVYFTLCRHYLLLRQVLVFQAAYNFMLWRFWQICFFAPFPLLLQILNGPFLLGKVEEMSQKPFYMYCAFFFLLRSYSTRRWEFIVLCWEGNFWGYTNRFLNYSWWTFTGLSYELHNKHIRDFLLCRVVRGDNSPRRYYSTLWPRTSCLALSPCVWCMAMCEIWQSN